jgi:transposase
MHPCSHSGPPLTQCRKTTPHRFEEVSGADTPGDALHRASKRQAAPHSNGTHVEHPKRSGRKPGEAYGNKAHRPLPDHVDEVIEVPCPARCSCGGEVVIEGVADQWVEDIPPIQVHVRQYRIRHGRCRACGKALQGRHPDQTSDACGAAGSQIGSYATALAVDLKKQTGVSERKICRLFSHFGLSATPGGVTQAVARAGRRATPAYRGLIAAARKAEVVAADESGWRVHGDSAWAWVFVGQATREDGSIVRFVVYLIAKGRGFAEASAILGAGFAQVIERDGWAPYRKFAAATHQTCVAHLFRRAVGMIEDATGDQARVPATLKEILADALDLRAARDSGELTQAALPGAVGALERRVDALLAGGDAYPPNVRLLGHLANERPHLFTFLRRDGVEACNWKAEQAIRPLVVNRKSWGGNFSWEGAATQAVLSSVIATARVQGKDPIEILVPLLRSPTPRLADLELPGIDEGEWRTVPVPAQLLPASRSP